MANTNHYKSHIWEFFPSSSRFRDIHILKFENVGQGHDVQHSQHLAAFDGKCSTSYLMATVMFALSITVFRDIRKIYNLTLKWRSRSRMRKRDLLHSTRNVRFHIGDCFRILPTWNIRLRKMTHTHTFTHTHRARDRVKTKDKINADLPKTDNNQLRRDRL